MTEQQFVDLFIQEASGLAIVGFMIAERPAIDKREGFELARLSRGMKLQADRAEQFLRQQYRKLHPAESKLPTNGPALLPAKQPAPSNFANGAPLKKEPQRG